MTIEAAHTYIRDCTTSGRPVDLEHAGKLSGLRGPSLHRFVVDCQASGPVPKSGGKRRKIASAEDGWLALAAVVLGGDCEEEEEAEEDGQPDALSE